ncbi:hypothetical protein [Clostridium sp. B9]|uniref:hypothetical protein n=1 Tax=Clostridium sp. B9 TaxID=3423224 RepID=UPI003D2EE8BD
MYLKSKWSNLGIKKKLFIISTAVILITSVITYTVLFALIPAIYMNSKRNSIEKSTDEILRTLENKEEINYADELNQYSYKNESFVFITTIKGEVVYASNNNMLAKYRIDPQKKFSHLL